MIDFTLFIYIAYFVIGLIIGRVLTAIQVALMKPKYESYNVIAEGEGYSSLFIQTEKESQVNSAHEIPGCFENVCVLDPRYYKKPPPETITVDYYLDFLKKSSG